jgi:tetratricopeptide (TPR) repeat protein
LVEAEMSHFLERGRLLAVQGHWNLAEKELRMAVGESPDLSFAHGLLALTLVNLKRKDEALAEAQTAVRLSPEVPLMYYYLAQVLDSLERFKDAEAAIGKAIEIDPQDADYRALQSGIVFQQSRWADSLAAAEEGLKQDPDHIGCLNLRGLALIKLGRRAEAGDNMAETIARGPENAMSHTVQGWNYLESSRPGKALECFRTALQLDPDLEYAKRGMVEALKARNPIYRLMLMYFLWMARLRGGAQWAVVLGFYIGMRLLNSAADQTPALRPYVMPIIVVYLIFCVLTWVAQPAFDLVLRLNRFGRYALSPRQIRTSNWFGGLLAAAIVLALIGWLWPSDLAIAFAIWFGVMVAPVAMALQSVKDRNRHILSAAAGVLGLIGLASIALAFSNHPQSSNAITVFIWGWVLFPWLVNIVTVR